MNDEQADSTEYDRIISIESLMSEVSRDEIVDTVGRVSSLDIPNTGCVAYPIIWDRLANSGNGLVRAIILFQKFEKRLNELNITHGTLICEESLEEPYVQVVEDVAKSTSMKSKRQGQRQSLFLLSILFQMITSTIKMGAVIADWFLTRLVTLFTSPVKESTVYIPPINRLDSTLPIVDALNTKPLTVITEPFWYYTIQYSVKSRLDPYEPSYSSQYLPIRGFVGQIYDLGTIVREVLTANSFALSVEDAIESEFGVCIKKRTRGIVRENLSDFHLVRALILRRSLRALFSSDHIKKVIIGTLDPTGRAIVYEASKRELQLYHIPHSIATTRPPYPNSNVTQFVSGDWDAKYYQQVVPCDCRWDWVKMGRPYLNKITGEYEYEQDIKRGRYKVLVATQPYSTSVRKQFIESILSCFDEDKFILTIKPHPDENANIYNNIELEHENVNVLSENLYNEINKSDLTVTIRSNVGLESIVVGTPTICFNVWEPFLLEQTYALANEIPVFKSETKMREFASQLDDNQISQLQQQQQTFIKQNYHIEDDIANKIANYIESD